jgi:hypothetical protein
MSHIEKNGNVEIVCQDCPAKFLERSRQMYKMVARLADFLSNLINRLSVVINECLEIPPIPLIKPAAEQL